MEIRRLAVAEDCEEELTRFVGCLERYGKERQIELQIETFHSGFELLETYQPVYDPNPPRRVAV